MSWLRWVILSVGSASVALVLALPASAQRAVAHATIVKVQVGTDAGEFTYKLTPNSVKVGTVIFKVSNRGEFGQSATLKISFKQNGFYEYLCTVPGEAGIPLSQAARGLKGVLKVV